MLKKISYILGKKQKLYAIGLFVLIGIGSMLEMLGISAILPLINIIMNPDFAADNELFAAMVDYFHITTNNQFIIVVCIGIIFLYLFKNTYMIMLYKLKYLYIHKNNKLISSKLIKSYVKQEYSFHVNHNIAEMQRNVITDVWNFMMMIQAFIQLLIDGTMCLAVGVFLLVLDFQTAIGILIIAGSVIGIFMNFYRKYMVEIGRKQRDIGEKNGKFIIEMFGGIKEIKILNVENYFIKRFEINADENAKITGNSMYFATINKPVMEFTGVTTIVLILIWKVVTNEDMGQFITTFSAVVLAAFKIMPAASSFSNCFSSIMMNKPSVNNVFKDLKTVEDLEKNLDTTLLSDIDMKIKNVFTIQNVAFRYNEERDYIFQNVNLTIEKNTSVGIIGASGAGKSTLMDLILGLYRPQEGEMLVDEKNIFMHLKEWRQQIGYIPQVIYLMDDTIRANIAFGIENQDINNVQLEEAIRQAQLTKFIDALPDGLDTKVGEQGVRLSGGQRQRIGIARALYHRPSVLVLDEATSALDNETEQAVMQAIDDLNGKINMFIIAHRLTTIKNCNMILEVKNQRVSLVKNEKGI